MQLHVVHRTNHLDGNTDNNDSDWNDGCCIERVIDFFIYIARDVLQWTALILYL